jgi:hypothetical protein
MAFGTAGEIINDAATEVGLVVPGGSSSPDPWASTDPNIIQLIAHLKSAGRELVLQRNWSYLRRECTITTVAGVSNYKLPDDFGGMVQQTGWVRSTNLPLGGPLTPQEWQYMKGSTAGVGLITIMFRPVTRTLQIYPDGTSAPGGETIVFEYQSINWCGGDDTITEGVLLDAVLTYPTKDAPDATADLVWFDKWLASRLLKLRFLEDKGMPTAAAERAYKTAFDAAAGADASAPVRSLNGRGDSYLLGERNVPETGYGSP